MIHSLKLKLPEFPGAPNQTRCFAHILNLVVKSIMSLFDASKKRRRSEQEADNDWDLQDEEPVGLEAEEEEEEDEQDEDVGVDDLEGWIDERESMSQSDKVDTAVAVEPVRQVLTKVRSSLYFIVHSNSARSTASTVTPQIEELNNDTLACLVLNAGPTLPATSYGSP
jgi:hypothetical protein